MIILKNKIEKKDLSTSSNIMSSIIYNTSTNSNTPSTNLNISENFTTSPQVNLTTNLTASSIDVLKETTLLPTIKNPTTTAKYALKCAS